MFNAVPKEWTHTSVTPAEHSSKCGTNW
jgi:hypothetical protein